MNPISLVFLDLDGTLIGPSGDVAESLWTALARARADQGLRLSVCTGRPSGGIASRIAARLDPDTPHIFHGGGVVRHVTPSRDGRGYANGVPVEAAVMPTDTVLGLVEEARRRNLTLELYTPDTIFVDEMTDVARAHGELLGVGSEVTDLMRLARDQDIVKAQWVIGDDNGDLADALAARRVPACHHAQANSPALPGVHFVTITRTDADKGAAVRRVAERLGVALAQTAGIGDSTGDVPMLEVVGRPFIMGDAVAALRERFETLPGVEVDGAAEAFARL